MRKLFQLSLLLVVIAAACTKKESSSSESKSIDPAIAESVARGQLVYTQYCIACHMKDGLGAPPMNPPLAGTSFMKGDKDIVINVVLKGMSGEAVDGQKYHNVMPPLDFLTNEQVADVLTYVRNSFGNNESLISSEEVGAARNKK
ncbi:hypothetical protein BH10BAC4_BH10BAC4_12880 [soil metagenome]